VCAFGAPSMRESFKKQEGSMKNNARLYLPWPLVSAFLASCGSRPAEAQPGRRENASTSIARLDGGCLLYRPVTKGARAVLTVI
jgi:hypothetical protein